MTGSAGGHSQISARKTGARDIEGGGDGGRLQESYEVDTESAREESRGAGTREPGWTQVDELRPPRT